MGVGTRVSNNMAGMAGAYPNAKSGAAAVTAAYILHTQICLLTVLLYARLPCPLQCHVAVYPSFGLFSWTLSLVLVIVRPRHGSFSLYGHVLPRFTTFYHVYHVFSTMPWWLHNISEPACTGRDGDGASTYSSPVTRGETSLLGPLSGYNPTGTLEKARLLLCVAAGSSMYRHMCLDPLLAYRPDVVSM